jgi:hypothetical protein
MLTRMIAITVVIGALAVGAHTAGIVDLKKIPKELGLSAGEPRYIIVAADITAGREGELQKDFEAVQQLVENAHLGDKIEVFLIHSRAESSQEAIFKAEMPTDEGPMGAAFKRAQKKAKQSFADCWNKSIVAALGDSRLVQQTDLFGFYRFVSQK